MTVRETTYRSRYVLLVFLAFVSLTFQIALWKDDISDLLKQPDPLATLFTAAWIVIIILHVFCPIAALFLGFYVAAVRIENPRAWLLLAVLITFAIGANGADIHDSIMTWTTPLKHAALVYRTAGVYSWPIWLMVFAIYFPERAAFDVRRPALKWILVIPAVIALLLSLSARVARNEGAVVPGFVSSGEDFEMEFLLYFCSSAFLIILFLKFVRTKDTDARRRLKVLFTGLAISCLPTLLLNFFVHRMPGVRTAEVSAWIQIPIYLAFALFPVTLAYVTVVQRALDVRDLVRQSLQYALARRGVVIVQSAVSLVVILGIAHFSGQVSFLARILITAAGVAAILVIGLGALRLGKWIDRKFFRDAYQTEQLLRELADGVRSIVELQPLLETVADKISSALHVSDIAVFLRESHSYQPALAMGTLPAADISFEDNAVLVKSLQTQQKPLDVYFDDRRSWIHELNPTDSRSLRELKTQLLLPLSRRDELLGFLSLGSKASEAPYSKADIELLQSVAAQTAVAVENGRLTAAVASQTAEREVILRELAIARDVQQRLFPQVLPQIAGIEYSATCRPAREVGGDYYDFLELPGPALGIAIGDVSGKGVPAALLMAGLQATLRGQTASGGYDICRLLSNVNRAVYATSPANRYATFFYGHYEPQLRRLTYVNAGHNAPLLLRGPDCAEIVRLDVGGAPVGLFPHGEYQSAVIDMRENDLLILFTDGISEAMNGADEEWGEENLMQICQQMSKAAPSLLMEHIFSAADGFAAGAPQHDDMTLMILRVQ